MPGAHDEAMAVLEDRQGVHARFVFTWRGESIHTIGPAWNRAMRAWQPDDVAARFAENDLRAKVAGQALDKGMDAASMLAHSSDAVTRRYYVRGLRKVQPLG